MDTVNAVKNKAFNRKKLEEWFDSLTLQQKDILIDALFEHKVDTVYKIADIELENGEFRKVIVGFSDWKQIGNELGRLVSKGRECEIVEIGKQIPEDNFRILRNGITKPYDLKEVLEKIIENDGDFDKKIFNYDEEIDATKQSVDYLWDNGVYGDAGQLLLCFGEIMDKYNEIDTDKQILLHNNLLDYEVYDRFVMEHSFGCYKKCIGILVKEV
ncbi:MAG: hypothetical protein FWC41_11385 [Firmicutes bacterium]|nr:hypothetical protein [Bacillota bacterium]